MTKLKQDLVSIQKKKDTKKQLKDEDIKQELADSYIPQKYHEQILEMLSSVHVIAEKLGEQKNPLYQEIFAEGQARGERLERKSCADVAREELKLAKYAKNDSGIKRGQIGSTSRILGAIERRPNKS